MTTTAPTHSIVMTGATRGIGLEAAKELLRRDRSAHLVLLSRAESAAAVRAQLEDISPHVSAVPLDLADTSSIARAARRVEDRLDAGELPPLTRVVCNAGVNLDSALHTSVDGYERTFAVNVLAVHLLLRALHPHLERSAKVVVTVSDAHFGDLRHTGGIFPRTAWDHPEVLLRPGSYPRPGSVRAGRRAYATSKLGGVHLVHAWARRLPDGAAIVSYNPSLVIGTGLAREMGGSAAFVMEGVMPKLAFTGLVDVPSSAGRKLADVVDGTLQAPNGSYIHRTTVTRSSDESYDPDREDELWAALEGIARS